MEEKLEEESVPGIIYGEPVPADESYDDDEDFYPSACATYPDDKNVSFIDNDFYDVIECLMHDSDDEFDFGYSPVAMPVAAASSATINRTSTSTAATGGNVPRHRATPTSMSPIPYMVAASTCKGSDLRCIQENYDFEDLIHADAKIPNASNERQMDTNRYNQVSVKADETELGDSVVLPIVLRATSVDEKLEKETSTMVSKPVTKRPKIDIMLPSLASSTSTSEATSSSIIPTSSSSSSSSSSSAMIGVTMTAAERAKGVGKSILKIPSAARKLAAAKRIRVNGKFKRVQNQWISASDVFGDSDK